MNPNIGTPDVGVTLQSSANLASLMLQKWYYQDPQGNIQGPFVSTEMAKWFEAGYFMLSLLLRRQCDKSFYMLGDLVKICNGNNPFVSKLPPLEYLNLHMVSSVMQTLMDPLQALAQQRYSMQLENSALQTMHMLRTMVSENLINLPYIHSIQLSESALADTPSSSGLPIIPQRPLENLTTPTDGNPINRLLRHLQNNNIFQPWST